MTVKTTVSRNYTKYFHIVYNACLVYQQVLHTYISSFSCCYYYTLTISHLREEGLEDRYEAAGTLWQLSEGKGNRK